MKLEDVEVGMKVVPHSKSTGCTFTEFNTVKSEHRKNDPWLYVCRIQNDGVIYLSPEMDDDYHATYFLSEDIEQWCDADEAPEGYYAVRMMGCDGCDLPHTKLCLLTKCSAGRRKDGCSVIFKKKISCKEAFDEIDKLSVTVETVLGNAEGTISTTDPVNHPSHYTSGEIECIDAIKASMSKEAFCGFLKGSVQKYLWRYEKKVNPAEDIKKAGWYRDRLEKEIHDNSQNN